MMKDAILDGQRRTSIFKLVDAKFAGSSSKTNSNSKSMKEKVVPKNQPRIIRGAFTNEASIYDTGRIVVGDTSDTLKSKARNIYKKKIIDSVESQPVLNQNDKIHVTEEDLEGKELKIRYSNPDDEVRERKK